MAERVKITDWEQYYQNEEVEFMPWYQKGLDQDFATGLTEKNILQGEILDIGTGPGTQAMSMAKRGYSVTATDLSSTAIKKAKIVAAKKGLAINFFQDDIVVTKIRGKFSLILDRGVFHVLDIDARPKYIENVHRLLAKRGFLFLKCFCYLEPGNEGPYRYKPREIEKYFQDFFSIVNIRESIFSGNRKPHPKALFCMMQKN